MKWPPKDILEILLLKYAADKINEARLYKGMNKSRLAKVVGVTRTTVDRWVAGRSKISGSVMVSLCDALDLTPRDLVPDDKELRKLRGTYETITSELPDPDKTKHDRWAKLVDEYEDLETNEARAAALREEQRAAG